MNNILEEITYSDGRMDSVVKSLDTPAKLKLRARTYEGINKNLSKRRGSVSKETFSIPNAFMAVEVPSSTGGSQYTITVPELNVRGGGCKKLRLNPSQINGMRKYVAANSPVVEKSVNDVSFGNQENVKNETIAVSTQNVVVPAETQVDVKMPEVQETIVQTEVVSQPEVSPVQNEQNTFVVDPLDAAREKVLNAQPAVTEEVNLNRGVEQVENTDVFKDLEKVTNEYAKIDEEYKKSAQALVEAQESLKKSKNDFEKIENNIKDTNAKIQERHGAIDSAKKETEEIEQQIRVIEEETKEKIRLVASAKEQKLREKHVKEQETSEVLSENQNYQNRINAKREEENALEQQYEKLGIQENEALDAKRKAQDRYNSKLEVFKAITLPEGINLEQPIEKVASVYNFPVSSELEETEERGYSYTKAA